MAKKDLFTVHGAKELAKELKQMAQGFQNKMVRPGLTQAVAEVRKEIKAKIKQDGLIDDRTMFKNIKSKVFSNGRGKGLTGRAGVLTSVTDENGVAVAKYASVQNYGTDKAGKGRNARIEARHFLEDGLSTAEPIATKKLITRTQEKVTAFHKSKGDPGKAPRK